MIVLNLRRRQKKWANKLKSWSGCGGGLADRAADSGPYDLSLIPLGEKKENKRERGRGWPFKNSQKLVSRQKAYFL